MWRTVAHDLQAGSQASQLERVMGRRVNGLISSFVLEDRGLGFRFEHFWVDKFRVESPRKKMWHRTVSQQYLGTQRYIPRLFTSIELKFGCPQKSEVAAQASLNATAGFHAPWDGSGQ